MKTSYEKRFDVACERLNYLVKNNRLCKEVYTDFKDNNLCHYTERMPLGKSVVGILYWLNDAGGCPDYVVKKKEELEKNYDCTVYAVTHEYLDFGECWDFWTVHDEDVEDYEYFKNEFENYKYTMAYVYNASEPDFSEFGTIGFSCNGGGMIRTC